MRRLSFLALPAVIFGGITFQLAGPIPAMAQPNERDTRELILLISPRAASGTPQIVVEAVNEREPVPLGLGVGHPESARMAIQRRARGRMAEWIRHNPDTPEGRLERYVVMRYGNGADRDTAFENLSRNPFVQHVEVNLAFEMHGLPSDPYVGTGIENPGEAQWGVHALNLPAAWEVTRAANAWIGIIDQGLDTTHPDLRVTHDEGGVPVFDGGSFRPHLSRDVVFNNCSVDEVDPEDGNNPVFAGHGSHVMGIAAANLDNGIGVAGATNASVFMVKGTSTEETDVEMFFSVAANGLDFARSKGAQVVNMSFGQEGNIVGCEGGFFSFDLFCNSMAVLESRDIVMVASSGNRIRPKVDFPARDPRTIAAGGLMLDPAEGPILWRFDPCPTEHSTDQCGSNVGPNQDLMAPAADILSTFYRGFDHRLDVRCGDSFFGVESGYGTCSGTSMAAPSISSLAVQARSTNPLLGKEDVRDVLISTASIPGTKDPELGHGIPDAAAAAARAFGTVAGQPLVNRLTPLFSFHSPPVSGAPQAETHLYTAVPQLASALLLDDDPRPFNTRGPLIGSYGAFPQFCTNSLLADCCPLGQPCCVGQGESCQAKILVDAQTQPRASVFVFTNDKLPNHPAPPLVPLHRLRYESALLDSCPSPPADPISAVRDFAYATSVAEIETYLGGAFLGGNLFEYEYDGVEGYVFEHCNSGCPAGAVALYRLFNAARHDTVIVPVSEVASMNAQGYFAPADPSLPELIGYAYPNVDSDSDGLIDGFEAVIGSEPGDADSDNDGFSDGQELLVYDRTHPNPSLHGYTDPCSNRCPLFADGFETGNTSQWTSTVP